MKQYRLAVLALHPITYQVPLWSLLGNHPQVDLTVLYCENYRKQNETPLLDGYDYKFLSNLSKNPGTKQRIWGRINPGIIRELRDGDYDGLLIHGYDTLTPWIALFAAKFYSVPLIFRGEATLPGVRPGWRQTLKRFLLKPFLSQMAAVLFSCTGNRQYLEYYGVQPEKLFLCPCAVDNDFFSHKSHQMSNQKEEFRAELGITPDSYVILQLAKLIPLKRTLDLLKAVKIVSEQIRETIDIVLVGDGPEKDTLLRFVQQHNLDFVHFVGFVHNTQVGKYIAMADLAVVLSEHDNSPKAMNEIMNFSLPIICTDTVGTAHDLVQQGENGFVVSVGDVEAIASHIHHLIMNRDLSRKMGERSFEIVSQWSFKQDVDGILEALASVVGS